MIRLLLFLFLVSALRAGLTLDAIDGSRHELLAEKAAKPSLFIFVSPFCSTTKAFVKDIQAVCIDHAAAVSIYIVESDPEVTKEVAVQHAALSDFKAPVLLDADQKLATALKATITPEAVLTGLDGQTLYQGRINDLYLGPTKRQRSATTRDLRDAIEAVLSGKPVPQPQHPAQGCKIGKKK